MCSDEHFYGPILAHDDSLLIWCQKTNFWVRVLKAKCLFRAACAITFERYQKIRRCTVRKDRGKLSHRVEVDEFVIGGKKPGKRGRGADGKTIVYVAVERYLKQNPETSEVYWKLGRARLQVALDYSSYSLETFINHNVKIGSIVATDKWSSYQPILNTRYNHQVINPSDQKGPESGLYGAHLIVSLVKRLIRSTFQGRLEPKYLQNYLDEYVFRFNRR